MRFSSRSGLTTLEVVFASAILATFFGTVFVLVGREIHGLRSVATTLVVETQLQELVARLEEELAVSAVGTGTTWLTADLAPGETLSVQVNQTNGFPFRGELLLGRGTADEERLTYERLGAGLPGFEELTRGTSCSDGSFHGENAEALWSGRAETLSPQAAAFPDLFDGRLETRFGERVFRGDGTGFSFQRPIDPAGGRAWFVDGEIRFGAEVAGRVTEDGWHAMVFTPRREALEANLGVDLNGDGDQVDTFDLGSLNLVAWDSSDRNWSTVDVALCPPILLQERCNHGGDLDGDGSDDPLFLWDEDAQSLHLSLFVLVEPGNGQAQIRAARTSIFLRNTLEALIGPS